jgi:hypothetical protein
MKHIIKYKFPPGTYVKASLGVTAGVQMYGYVKAKQTDGPLVAMVSGKPVILIGWQSSTGANLTAWAKEENVELADETHT